MRTSFYRMKVISIPYRLRLATSLLLFVFPLIAGQVALISGAPWWRLPLPQMIIFSTVGLLVAIAMIFLLNRAKRSVFIILRTFLTVWIIISLIASVKIKSTGLAFFAVFLSGYSLLVLSWIKNELSRSFFDPELKWYHGAPKPIPYLACVLKAKKDMIDFHVSRIDLEGVFLFRNDPISKIARNARIVELGIKFRDFEVQTYGQIMVALRENNGFGVVFKPVTPDDEKKLRDFIHKVQGEGYEATISH